MDSSADVRNQVEVFHAPKPHKTISDIEGSTRLSEESSTNPRDSVEKQ